mmetsp:Transcript_7470/g.10509  ORF Transcript_7470/g.10509 Transcript_7470/m.10509 type:complete len:172 (+) Transcript_7470:388-903(+)
MEGALLQGNASATTGGSAITVRGRELAREMSANAPVDTMDQAVRWSAREGKLSTAIHRMAYADEMGIATANLDTMAKRAQRHVQEVLRIRAMGAASKAHVALQECVTARPDFTAPHANLNAPVEQQTHVVGMDRAVQTAIACVRKDGQGWIVPMSVLVEAEIPVMETEFAT